MHVPAKFTQPSKHESQASQLYRLAQEHREMIECVCFSCTAVSDKHTYDPKLVHRRTKTSAKSSSPAGNRFWAFRLLVN